MTWEETIEYIQGKEEYKFLVEKAYFDRDLVLNVERFSKDVEFKETLKHIQKYAPNAKSILDIGCGNGISSISFAQKGYEVTAVEPDPSNSIGAGAIRTLKNHYNLKNIEIFEAFAEDIAFKNESFDIVYIRQAMHHANDLTKFIGECGRVLKKGGLLVTIRDHVVFDAKDKEWFLASHPLHKFYGGENAYHPKEYKNAMTDAGLQVIEELKHYDSEINFFPTTIKDLELKKELALKTLQKNLKRKIGPFAKIPFIFNLYKRKVNYPTFVLNEMKIPGRMYSYMALKK